MPKTVRELAQIVQGKVIGNGSLLVRGITNLESPEPESVTFVQDARRLKDLEESPVACILVPPAVTESSKTLIQVKNPKLAWAHLLDEFYPSRTYPKIISAQAQISPKARLGKNIAVEAFAVIGDGAEIGEGTVIRSHAVVDRGVKVGRDSLLHPGVVLYEKVQIGSRVIIHSGTVIGADGFGYVQTEKGQEKIPQVGTVLIEDDVELGACVTIDRATVGATIIRRGCKIDNLVQIGHNTVIGEHTVISAQSGISGSCKIGARVTMGGGVGLGDHVEIGDGCMVGAGAGFPSGKKIPPKQIVFGQPARPYEEARRQIAAQLRSAEMLEDIRKLKRELAQLQKKIEIARETQPSS